MSTGDSSRQYSAAAQPDYSGWLEVVRAALVNGQAPQKWPQTGDDSAAWRALVEDILATHRFIRRLAQGDLSDELYVRGQWAGTLKALQANLRHLTWQVQQVAAGDLTQQADFMGEFSEAFNQMTDNLRQALEAQRQQHLLDEALRDTAAALNSALGLEDAAAENCRFDVLLKNLGRLAPFDLAEILLVGEDGALKATRCANSEYLPADLLKAALEIDLPLVLAPFLHQMSETGQPLWLEGTQSMPWTQVLPWACSYLGAPVMIKEQAVGYVCLMSATPAFYTSDHGQRLMAFANLAATAIEKARLFEQIKLQAITDPLTGVFNRRHFFALAEEEFERAGRYGNALTVLMLDIDHFKQVNDRYGHQAGDAVLKGVVGVCVAGLRQCDLIGRYGGEEFVIMLPQTGKSEAAKVAERLQQSIANQLFPSPAGPLHVTVSIGVAQQLADGASLLTLLERADQAMYTAKLAGRNQVQVA